MTFSETTVTGQKFRLGRTVITQRALAFCEDFQIDYLNLIVRHAVGDFGEVGRLTDAKPTAEEQTLGALATSDDLTLNACAIYDGAGMVMSVYGTKGETKIWIQTLQAGSETYTTVLLPSEY